MAFFRILRAFAKSPEPELGEAQAEVARFSAGLDLLAPYLVDTENTIGSALDRMRAAGEHAKAETVVALLPALVVDGDG